MVFQKQSKHVHTSVGVPPAPVTLRCCTVRWMSSEGGTPLTVFLNRRKRRGSSTAHKLVQTGRREEQVSSQNQVEISSVYIPGLLAPPWSTAALQQTNSDWLLTSELPHLRPNSETTTATAALCSCCPADSQWHELQVSSSISNRFATIEQKKCLKYEGLQLQYNNFHFSQSNVVITSVMSVKSNCLDFHFTNYSTREGHFKFIHKFTPVSMGKTYSFIVYQTTQDVNGKKEHLCICFAIFWTQLPDFNMPDFQFHRRNRPIIHNS